MKKLIYSTCVIAGLVCGCASSVKVTKVDENFKTRPGVYYALPKTVITVELPITNIIKTPGRFSADPLTNYFLDAPITTKKETTFTLGPALLRTTAVPDTDQIYHVKIGSHFFEDRALQVELDENGLMTTASAEADNRAIEFFTQTLETGASIAGKILKFGGKLTDPTSAQKYLDLLQDIKEQRYNLITAQLNPGVSLDGEALRIALDELKTMEKAITEEFLGKSKTTVWVARFEVTPQAACATASDVVLMKLHPADGISEATFVNEAPKGFVNAAAAGTEVKLSIRPDVVGVVAAIPKPKAVTKSGFFYRYPAPSRAQLYWENKTYGREDISVAQFGHVLSLPSSTGSKSSKQQVTLFKATGAMSKVSISSKSWDPAQVGKAGAAATSVIEGDDKLARLERERKILEETKKIQDAQKALEPPQ